MKAIAVRRGETTPSIIERSVPTPEPSEVLVRTLRVGIDGTDHEVVGGTHGNFPNGADHQILGHEAIGIVEDPNGTDLEAGTLVVPTVRRPLDGSNEYFERGEPDMAPDGLYLERGIAGAHGYMAEYFTSRTEFLVQVRREFAETGFLIEPISNSEKAFEHADASRSAFDWSLESALVLGNGPLGLLTLAILTEDCDRTYCLGRRDRPDPTIDIIERLGATYVNSRKTSVPEIPTAHEPIDFVCEATGHAKHAFETIDALAPNGVGVLLGIPSDWQFEIDGGRLHREFVLENKALIGSVNSHRKHFEAAKGSLASFPEWFADEIITDVYEPAETEIEEPFKSSDDEIKSVIEFDTL